jgi:hypothetical protein
MAKKLSPAELGIRTAATVQGLVEKRGAKLSREDLKTFFTAFAGEMMRWLVIRRL